MFLIGNKDSIAMSNFSLLKNASCSVWLAFSQKICASLATSLWIIQIFIPVLDFPTSFSLPQTYSYPDVLLMFPCIKMLVLSFSSTCDFIPFFWLLWSFFTGLPVCNLFTFLVVFPLHYMLSNHLYNELIVENIILFNVLYISK